MVSQTGTRNWWQRFRHSIRRPRRNAEGYELPPVGSDGLLMNSADEEKAAETGLDRTGPLGRWTKRDHVLSQLQEGYEQVTRLVETIQRHMASQAERTDRICTALEQLARNSADAPDISRQQVRMLESIAGQLEVTSGRTQRLAEAVEEVPRLARTQTDALVGINRQLSMISEQEVFTSQALDKLGQATRTTGEANLGQTEMLRQMCVQSEEYNATLRQMVASHNRRFLIMCVLTIVLALAGIGALVATIVVNK